MWVFSRSIFDQYSANVRLPPPLPIRPSLPPPPLTHTHTTPRIPTPLPGRSWRCLQTNIGWRCREVDDIQRACLGYLQSHSFHTHIPPPSPPSPPPPPVSSTSSLPHSPTPSLFSPSSSSLFLRSRDRRDAAQPPCCVGFVC